MSSILAWIGTDIGSALALLFTINLILLSFVLLLENRQPEKTLAWLVVFVAFPIIGFILYLFLGHDWHKRSYKDRRASYLAMDDRHEDAMKDLSLLHEAGDLERTLRYFATSTTGLRMTRGNSVRILTDAHEKYPRMLDALKKAERTIDVEYFIFRNDRSGNEMMDILKLRAKHGVRVRFLVDGMGSFGFGRQAFPALRDAGVEAHYFAPVITPFFFFKANYRDHRKIVTIDNEIAFTGGINIGNEYLGESHRGPWRDTSVEIRGPAVKQFAELFEEAWERTTGKHLAHELPTPKHVPDGEALNVIPSGPDTDWSAVHQLYLTLIGSAKKSLKIQTPYFIPDEGMLEALKNAALRGVELHLMIPRYPDSRYLYWVANTYIADLLRAGAHVYEYTVGFLHPKVIIADDTVATVGTCNIDIRSFWLDFEVNILTSGAGTIRHLLEDFDRDLKLCEEVDYLNYINRPLSYRIRDSVVRLIAPLL